MTHINITERAKTILVQPLKTWRLIDSEQHDLKSLFVPYMVALAAIPSVCNFVGMAMVGMSSPTGTVRWPFGAAMSMMLNSYVLMLMMTFGMGLLISHLAPFFGGSKNLHNGMKVAVFASTPVMLAGFVNLLPAASMLNILAALYGFYLLYLGLPVVMKTDPEKTPEYTLVTVISSVIAAVVLNQMNSSFSPI